jgi:hypothetical protein
LHFFNKLTSVALLIAASTAYGQDPSTTATFPQAIQGMPVVQEFNFGTNYNRNIRNLAELAAYFEPYGIAGTIVINQEWERYQTFNTTNFVFTPTTLDLTATIPKGGGLWPGGIASAQIWSKMTMAPGMTGHLVYATEVRMRIPNGPGMWPDAWFFTKQWGIGDMSEIDNPEFFDMKWQTMLDWTGNNHGPGVGTNIYKLTTDPYVWHPGLNFTADYHDYQTYWTEDAVYKYVDGTLVQADHFTWTSHGAAQIGVNLAVGSNVSTLPGLQPNSLSEFPAVLSVDHITIWGK